MSFTIWSVRGLAAFVGASGIFSAAFGSHGLEKVAVAGGLRWWAIGAALHLVTAPTLLIAADWVERSLATRATPALLAAGLLLFSGSLYAMALGAPRWLGAITPLGGLALAAGWLTFVVR